MVRMLRRLLADKLLTVLYVGSVFGQAMGGYDDYDGDTPRCILSTPPLSPAPSLVFCCTIFLPETSQSRISYYCRFHSIAMCPKCPTPIQNC